MVLEFLPESNIAIRSLYPNKTMEIIIYRQGTISNRMIPQCTPGIQRVTSMIILGVEFDETLSFKNTLIIVVIGLRVPCMR